MRGFVVYVLLIIPCLLNAQSFSIEQLWNQLDSSSAFKKEALRVAIQKGETTIDRLDRLPLVYGDVNLQRNLIIPTTPVPAIAFDPSAPEGTYIPLRFATRWSSRAGAQLEWKLFDPARKANDAENKLLVERIALEAEETKQHWKREATLAYASIILATAQYKMAVEDSTSYQQILKISKDRYEAGRATAISYLDAEEQMARKRIQLAEAWSVLLTANSELEKYADLSSFTVLSSDIDQIMNLLKPFDLTYYAANLAELDMKLNELNRQDLKRQLLPTVSFNAYLGSQYFNNELRLFDDQFWYGNSYANIALRIPISAYFLQTTSAKQIGKQRQLRRLEWEEKQTEEKVQREQRATKVNAATKKIAELSRIVRLCEEKKVAQKNAFEAGRILLTDYNLANMDYWKAQQELWQAQYDWVDLSMK